MKKEFQLFVNTQNNSSYFILLLLGIMIAMIIASETSHPKYKVFFIFIASMGLHFGELLAAAESYLIRDWKILHIVFYAPVWFFLYFVLSFLNRLDGFYLKEMI